MLRKIFPSGSVPQYAFKVILLAEGYQATQQQDFHNSCQEFVKIFLSTPPFNLTRIKPNWINIYSDFQASNQSGAANNASSPGRTVFESVFTVATKTLTIDQTKLNDYIDDPGTSLPFGNDRVVLTNICKKGNYSRTRTASLIVLLLPPIAGEPTTIECESQLGVDDYYFIATTTNNHWHQAISRTIAHKLGLGNEFEMAGDDYQTPRNGDKDAWGINLQYLPSPPTSNRGSNLKWRNYFSIGQRILPPIVHSKTGDTSVPDNTTNTVPSSPSNIEFWEGGGGFRTGIYRSAKDCLMRRRIGDPQLPVSTQPVAFCYVCRTFLKSILE